jgi:hypothetical protein
MVEQPTRGFIPRGYAVSMHHITAWVAVLAAAAAAAVVIAVAIADKLRK